MNFFQTQSQPLAKSTLGVFGIVTLSLVAWCVAQQEPKKDVLGLPLPPLQLPSVPSLESPQPLVDDPRSDPLFQEIQRMILAGNKDRLAPPSPLTHENKWDSNIVGEDLLSSARWHAVESILAAARMLEEDVAISLRRNDLEQVGKISNAIKVLRGQALGLLAPGK